MISTQTLLAFSAATLLFAMSPGPNTFFVISQAFTRGMSAAALAVAGLVLASVVYLAATVAGLVALMDAWPVVFNAIRLAGAIYIAYLGVRILRSPGASLPADAQTDSQRSPLLQGFVTGFSNPKAVLYWSAFLPQFLDQSQSATPQLVVLGILGALLEVPVLFAYAYIAMRSRGFLSSPRSSRVIDRLAGTYFVALGAHFGYLIVRGDAQQ
jgi:homoserine/homoserine lactone efflux protein